MTCNAILKKKFNNKRVTEMHHSLYLCLSRPRMTPLFQPIIASLIDFCLIFQRTAFLLKGGQHNVGKDYYLSIYLLVKMVHLSNNAQPALSLLVTSFLFPTIGAYFSWLTK